MSRHDLDSSPPTKQPFGSELAPSRSCRFVRDEDDAASRSRRLTPPRTTGVTVGSARRDRSVSYSARLSNRLRAASNAAAPPGYSDASVRISFSSALRCFGGTFTRTPPPRSAPPPARAARSSYLVVTRFYTDCPLGGAIYSHWMDRRSKNSARALVVPRDERAHGVRVLGRGGVGAAGPRERELVRAELLLDAFALAPHLWRRRGSSSATTRIGRP